MTEPSESAELHAQIPWEERARIGTWRGYVDTLVPSLIRPGRFFSVLAEPGGPRSFGDSLRFDLVTHYLGSVGIVVFYSLVPMELPGVMAPLSSGGRLALMIGLFLLSGPAGVLFDLGYALVVHGTLRFLGPTPNGLRGTTRAVMYGGGATVLNSTLILTAFFIPSLWTAYCTIIALERSQRVTRGQALTAVIVPSGVLIMLAFIALAMVAGMAGMGDKLSALGLSPAPQIP
jgi:hypothetical protein